MANALQEPILSIYDPTKSYLAECFGFGSDVHDNNVAIAMQDAAMMLAELTARGESIPQVPVGNDRNATIVAIGALIGADHILIGQGADENARKKLYDYTSGNLACLVLPLRL